MVLGQAQENLKSIVDGKLMLEDSTLIAKVSQSGCQEVVPHAFQELATAMKNLVLEEILWCWDALQDLNDSLHVELCLQFLFGC